MKEKLKEEAKVSITDNIALKHIACKRANTDTSGIVDPYQKYYPKMEKQNNINEIKQRKGQTKKKFWGKFKEKICCSEGRKNRLSTVEKKKYKAYLKKNHMVKKE